MARPAGSGLAGSHRAATLGTTRTTGTTATIGSTVHPRRGAADPFTRLAPPAPLARPNPPATPARPLRLLLTADAVGGVWVHAIELARALTAAGRARVVVGGGPRPSEARLAAAAGLRGVELAHLYRRAAVYVAPSSYEPFGLAPAEAALAGCGVVANDLPPYREVWGAAARYFARNDPRSLAAALDALYDNPAQVARPAAAGRRRVGERYTTARMAHRYLRLYRRFVQAGPLTPGRPPAVVPLTPDPSAVEGAGKSPPTLGCTPPFPAAHVRGTPQGVPGIEGEAAATSASAASLAPAGRS